jgi:hypothetical protein
MDVKMWKGDVTDKEYRSNRNENSFKILSWMHKNINNNVPVKLS